MKPHEPSVVMKQVADVIPPPLRSRIIIIGSLAAGYHFFRDTHGRVVTTKDIDCLFVPRKEAQHSAAVLTNQLLAAQWTHRQKGEFGRPQPTPEPRDAPSGLRLNPPGGEAWFLELLTTPESENDTGKRWVPVEISG